MHKPLSDTKIKAINKQFAESINSKKEVVFLLQSVDDPINVGSFFRLAEALNASLVLTGETPTPPNAQISMTSKGLERSVDWTYIKDIEEAVFKLKELGFDIVGVEVDERSVLYSDYSFKNKTCLVMGSEAHGLYKKTLDLCDSIVAIPMLGKGLSLNVVMAAGIVGYQAIN